MTASRAIFLDRDGTLMAGVDYCGDPAQVAVFPGVPAALAELKGAGFRLVIVTNQSGIWRGLITETQFHAVQAELFRQLGDGLIDASYFCPDAPDQPSGRRKPAPGMLLEAAADLQLDLTRSCLVGDHATDIEAARRARLSGAVLVLTGHGARHAADGQPDFTAPDFPAAARWILEHLSHG